MLSETKNCETRIATQCNFSVARQVSEKIAQCKTASVMPVKVPVPEVNCSFMDQHNRIISALHPSENRFSILLLKERE